MFGDDWDKEDWAIVILVFAMFAGIIGLQMYYT
ncbi:TMhelix containing protein [Vibrio phage 1.187.O._10N.286.49.F1]|nr:TMhelix containing protein [Vibrio phage 1.187.O._10N.286.49.F1]